MGGEAASAVPREHALTKSKKSKLNQIIERYSGLGVVMINASSTLADPRWDGA
jgi:hypothetical protein